MAQRTKLAAVLNGLVQNVDLTADELVVDSITLGGTSGTNLTQTVLDSLISNSHASGSDNQTIVAGSGLSGGGSGATVTLDVNVDDSTIEIATDTLQVKDGGITFTKLDSALQTTINGKQDTSEKGQANGYASLDGSGKVPVSQLPNAIMEYQGVWDASTNDPTLADGVGNADEDIGDVYRVSVAGTQDLGSGSQTFDVGDYVILNADKIWEKADTTDAVSSVNGMTGDVSLDAADIPYDNGTSGLTATDTQAAIDEVEGRVDALEAGAGSASALAKSMTAGESMAADTSFLVRFAVDGETAGRMYKATNAAAATDGKFYAVGIALKASAVSAGDSVTVSLAGTHTLGASDTPFAGTDIGKAVYLTTAGGFSVTAPSSSGTAAYRIGVVEDTDKIFVDGKQLNGIN